MKLSYNPLRWFSRGTLSPSPLRAYPNPAPSFLTVEFIPQGDDHYLIVYNMEKRMVLVQKVHLLGTGKQTVQLNISTLEPGSYTLQLLLRGDTQNRPELKFVKVGAAM